MVGSAARFLRAKTVHTVLGHFLREHRACHVSQEPLRSIGVTRRRGQAVVTIEGRDHYLGPWRTRASTVEYDRLIGEWLARGRPDTAQGTSDEITVSELMAAYWTFANEHYRKDGKPTSQIGLLRLAFRPLLRLYGPTLANRFGPLSLNAVRAKPWLSAGVSRAVVNSHVGRVRRMFRWGVENFTGYRLFEGSKRDAQRLVRPRPCFRSRKR